MKQCSIKFWKKNLFENVIVHMLINFVQMKLCFEWKKKTRFVGNLQPSTDYIWFGKPKEKQPTFLIMTFTLCSILYVYTVHFVQGSRRMPASLSISMAPLSDTRTTWVTLTITTLWARWMNTGWVAGWMWVSSSRSSLFKGIVSQDAKKSSKFSSEGEVLGVLGYRVLLRFLVLLQNIW